MRHYIITVCFPHYQQEATLRATYFHARHEKAAHPMSATDGDWNSRVLIFSIFSIVFAKRTDSIVETNVVQRKSVRNFM